MSTQQVIERIQNLPLTQLTKKLKDSVFFAEISQMNLIKGEKPNLILTGLFVSFVKMALIDRDYDDNEEAHVIKRLKRFINKDTVTLFKATQKIKTLINQNRQKTDLIYSFSVYLAAIADQKTKDKIFNSFIQLAQADSEISEEEKFLIKNYSLIFGMNEKEAFEQILKASLLAQSAEREDSSVSNAEESTQGPHQESEAPIIKFDF
jgi:uncharacterized tellurite resistance protein B-like protein